MGSATADRAGAALETHELTVRYGRFTAVDDVSLTVRAGEIFGLLGPNGAGKTSMIRALTTVLPVSSGSAVVAGHPLSDQLGVRAAIGVLPESNGYPAAQRALSYLRFYGQLFGLDRDEAASRGERLLEQFGLGGNDQRIATFSRGMRQRLGLCRAMINDPTVLFLDEPTLGLDPSGQEEILAHLADVAHRRGTTVMLCSHLLDEVERVCDRVAIMHTGRVVASGSVDEVVEFAGIGATASIRVRPDSVPAAVDALGSSVAASMLSVDPARPGTISVSVGSSGQHGNDGSDLIRLLLDAGIDVRFFDLRGARLSDAFLAVTKPDSSPPIRRDDELGDRHDVAGAR